ncbi:MAG TPA: carboxyl transferase domain-containing protein, partial [Natronoarchaeum rubrum]|nr:carboxyl transferase domain-containing protein [Natronoarchaeum rubrum]
MKVRIGADATDDEAAAIAAALSSHVEESVEVYVGDAASPSATRSPDESSDAPDPAVTGSDGGEELGPTERERQLLEEIEEIQAGGPEKYRERLDEQGKLFVRDRLDLWFGEEGVGFEDGQFANFDAWHPDSPDVEEYDPNDRLPADGLLTGAAEFEDRDVHFMANDFTVKAGSMAERGVEKFLRMQQRALKSGRPVL